MSAKLCLAPFSLLLIRISLYISSEQFSSQLTQLTNHTTPCTHPYLSPGFPEVPSRKPKWSFNSASGPLNFSGRSLKAQKV